MAKDDKPSDADQRRPISPDVFDSVFQAGIDHANALDLDEPELRLPDRAAGERGSNPDGESLE